MRRAFVTTRRTGVRLTGSQLGTVVLALVAGGVAQPAAAQVATPVVSAYPSPGVKTASPTTQISIRGVPAAQLRALRVVGSDSGPHAGRLAAHSDGRGASFLPRRPFRPGERVTVTGIKAAGAGREPYSFRIARFTRNSPLNTRLGRVPAAGTMRLVTRPDLRPPAWDVKVARRRANGSKIFVGPKLLGSRNGQQGVQILTPAGKVLFWDPMPVAQKAADVRVQTYRGQPVLTYWRGYLAVGEGDGEGVIVDSSYRVLKRVRMGNGYRMDIHEFRLTPQGTALAMAYQAVRYDLSSVGRPANGSVVDNVIQEIDLETGLVLFEWHSLGNAGLDESSWRGRPGLPWDYFHANSIYRDGEDAIVVSARHTSTVYRIGRATGEIAWRLGGPKSDFRLPRGGSFARQHDAEVQPNGDIRLFDNSERGGRARSRVITLRLDRRTRRASLVAETRRADGMFAGTQGNAAPLPGGTTFVGWGSRGVISEIDGANRLLFDAFLPTGWDSYRAYRGDWSATPLSIPKVAARIDGSRATRVFASWNGATEVASWQVLAGPTPDTLSAVHTMRWRDLETVERVASPGPFFAVRALDAAGRVLSASHAVRRR